MNAVEVHCAECGAQMWVDSETYYRELDPGRKPEDVEYLCKQCIADLNLTHDSD